jgi:hypothetical protein
MQVGVNEKSAACHQSVKQPSITRSTSPTRSNPSAQKSDFREKSDFSIQPNPRFPPLDHQLVSSTEQSGVGLMRNEADSWASNARP